MLDIFIVFKLDCKGFLGKPYLRDRYVKDLGTQNTVIWAVLQLLINYAHTVFHSKSQSNIAASQILNYSQNLHVDVWLLAFWHYPFYIPGVRIADSDPHYFISEDGSLEIFSADPADTATYSCTAINVAGVMEKRITLFVQSMWDILSDLSYCMAWFSEPIVHGFMYMYFASKCHILVAYWHIEICKPRLNFGLLVHDI